MVEIRMLRSMCGYIRKDKIPSDYSREKIGVALIEEKMIENMLRWLGRVQRRSREAPVEIAWFLVL